MNKPIYKKWWFWLIIVLVLGAIGNMGDNKKEANPAANSPTESVVKQEDVAKEENSEPAVKEAASPQPEEDKTEKYAAYIEEFEKTVLDIDTKAQPVFQDYVEKMNGAADGSVSLIDAYQAAKAAKSKASELHMKFSEVDVPSDLPKEVKSLLNDSKSDFSTAYFVREKAYKSAMAYLDEQKVSHIDSFKENLQSSDQFILSAVTKMTQAKLTLEEPK